MENKENDSLVISLITELNSNAKRHANKLDNIISILTNMRT